MLAYAMLMPTDALEVYSCFDQARGKAAWTLILLAGALATAPWVARELLIDACLDSGGSWNRDFLECSR